MVFLRVSPLIRDETGVTGSGFCGDAVVGPDESEGSAGTGVMDPSRSCTLAPSIPSVYARDAMN